MLTLPADFSAFLMPFAPLFTSAVFVSARLLLAGAILTPGPRTVTAALRALGRAHESNFQNYHRVLNRAQWSPRAAARVLLSLLVAAFVPSGPIVLGLDDTIERRRGSKIRAKGIYRDPVRSTHSHFVKASGLRWLSLMLLVPVPFAKRIWALPFLTALCPSQGYQQKYHPQRITPKKLTDWARQIVSQTRLWLPKRALIVVADSSFAVLQLLTAWQKLNQSDAPFCAVTRLRLDARLYAPAPPHQPKQMGRPRLKGHRLPTLGHILQDSQTAWTRANIDHWYGRYGAGAGRSGRPRSGVGSSIEFVTGTAVWYHCGQAPLPIRWVLVRDPNQQFEPQALLCTDINADALDILSWYARRWAVEVTYREVREHLGVETQRQWNDLAIARTTPALLGLFSLVTLFAHQLTQHSLVATRQTAWYVKEQPTFSDALATVRRHLWEEGQPSFSMSQKNTDMQKYWRPLFQHFTEILCYAT